eukprot:c22407_g1_i1 orf=187-1875(+)
MLSETEELRFAIVQAPATEENEHGYLSVQRATHRSCLIKLPRSPVHFSLGSLPDDEEAMETSVSVCRKAKWPSQNKTALQLSKFFYPRFKRRPCGIITVGSQRCSAKKQQKNASPLQVASIPETSSCMMNDGVLQQMDNGNNPIGFPHEVLLEDVVNCESPANFVRRGEIPADKAFSSKACTATPNPNNGNSAFEFMQSPCSDNFPRLRFASIKEQHESSVALPSRFFPSPYCGRGADAKKTHALKTMLCSNVGNVLLNSSSPAEPQILESGLWVEEHEKENVPLTLSSNSKAVLVYRSLQKTKKRRRRLSPGQVLSKRQASYGGAGFLKTRSCARLKLDIGSRQLRSGPVLRSAQNDQMQNTCFGRDKLNKERSLSAYGSKKSLVKALLEKYLRNRRLKCGNSGTPSCREICLPFLNREAGRRVECFYCKACVTPHELTSCSHKDCKRSYHLTCAQSLEDFNFLKNGDPICPQHVCMVCKGHNRLKVFRCERCTAAAHKKCLAFPEYTIFLDSKPDCFICWRHPQDWRLQSESCCSTRYQRQIQRKFLNGYLSPMLQLSLV